MGNSCVIKSVVNLDKESIPGLRNYYVDGVTSKENNVTRTRKAPPPKRNGNFFVGVSKSGVQ